jgi:riboflavin kinase/FMN adenylyltransferase
MPTKLIRSIHHIQPDARGGVVTIGNFDGVHLGHQQLLAQTCRQAKRLGVSACVMTFEPHAFEFFAKDQVTVPRLTRLREKFVALAENGMDNVIVLPFNQELTSLSASDFVDRIIVNTLSPKHIVVGDDFRFGYKRQGDAQLLAEKGRAYGFGVETLPTVIFDAARISSTRIRQALAVGDHQLANALLGRPYAMLGRVVHGDKLGQKLGFPTANLYLHRRLTPVHGIYTVLMTGVADKPWPGVANVGTRPTVDGTKTLLEVHLLNFNQDIYGRHVQVIFCEKLRDEERYANLDLLQAQIAKDVISARNYFIEQGRL